MNENFQIYGEWWLPNNEENRISGILSYDTKTGIKLDLIGSFIEEISDWRVEREVIIGVTDEFSRVYLYESYEIQSQLRSTSDMVTRSYIKPKYIILDKYGNMELGDDATLDIQEIEYHPKYLSNWVGSVNFTHNSNGENRSIEYRFPPDIQILNSSSLSLAISFNNTDSISSFNRRVIIQSTPFVKLTREEPQSPNWFLGQICRIHWFFNYIWKIKIPCLKIMIIKDGRSFPLYTNIWSLLQENEQERSGPFSVQFDDFELVNLQNIVRNWFTYFDNQEFAKLFDMYLHEEILNTQKMFISLFATHVKILEFISREWCNDQEYTLPIDVQEFRTELINFFNEYDSSSTRINNYQEDFLRTFNRRSFRNLLRTSLENLDGILSISRSNLNRIVANRNFYTHYQLHPGEEELVCDGEDLYELAFIAKNISTLLLLKRLGFRDELLNRMISL